LASSPFEVIAVHNSR